MSKPHTHNETDVIFILVCLKFLLYLVEKNLSIGEISKKKKMLEIYLTMFSQ
jgi:hypothetical protein